MANNRFNVCFWFFGFLAPAVMGFLPHPFLFGLAWVPRPWSICSPVSASLLIRMDCGSYSHSWSLALIDTPASISPPGSVYSGYSPSSQKSLLKLKRWHLALVSLFLFWFLGPHLQHLEVPRLGVELELQLPAYTTATATPDLSCIFDLYRSSWQCWIPDLLDEARDWTHILMDTN